MLMLNKQSYILIFDVTTLLITPIIINQKQKYLMLWKCRAVARSFGFLKQSGGSRLIKQLAQQFNKNIWSDFKILLSQQNIIPIDLTKLKLQCLPDTEDLQKNVNRLHYGLDKFLNGQLVFGDQNIGRIPKSGSNSKINFAEISGYVEPENDKKLFAKADQFNCKYVSSTSNISGPLVALYHIFSAFRTPQMGNIYQGVQNRSSNWMVSFRKPTTFFLKKLPNGKEAITSDKGILPSKNQVLMDLGHTIEYLLTHPKEQTESLLRGQPFAAPSNYYRYSLVNNEIMLRSQIDCLSYDQNGKPFVFEIKSRACAPIRYDVENYKLYTDYQINSKRGTFQSFQRQYYDLIRGGFIKYVMQVKIGKMDGAFIAYHNTEKIYGYQYVKMSEMVMRGYGDQYNLQVSFICISKMLTIVLNHVRESLPQYKDYDFKLGFYGDYKSRRLITTVEPLINPKQCTVPQADRQNIKNVFDYFNKYELKNPVIEFQFDFFIYLNGKKLHNNEVLLTPLDTLEMKYKAHQKRFISRDQYALFLSNAYKEEDIFNSIIYKGLWGAHDSKQ